MEAGDKDKITEDLDTELDAASEEEWDASVDLITLTDEAGVEHEFELLDTLEREGTTYVALLAGAENPELLEGDGNLVIMKSITDELGEEYLELIEDDDEFDDISDLFMERLSDLFEFEVEDDEDEDEDEPTHDL